MAKNEKPVSGKQPKMTVMLFQLEGSDETLREGFRTISNAIDKLVSPGRLAPPAIIQALPAPSNGYELESEILDAEPVEAALEAERPKFAKTPRSNPRQPKILELDLKAGSTPLRQYLEQKSPTTDNRKYLHIAAWMKENLSIDTVTIDHIYTAYRHMGWTSQKDVGAPLRAMKSQNGWFANGKEKGSYAINHIGIDVAARTNGE